MPAMTGVFVRVVTVAILLALAAAVPAHAQDEDFPGITGDGEYTSPQFDVDATWTDAWEIGDPSDPLVAHAMGDAFEEPVASTPEYGDIVFLSHPATGSAVVSIGFFEANSTDTELFEAAMRQESFLTDNMFLNEGAELVDTDVDETSVAGIGRDAPPDTEHVVYMSTTFYPDADVPIATWIGVDLYEVDDYDTVLDDIASGIEVADFDAFPLFTADDVVAAGQETDDDAATPDDTDTDEDPSGIDGDKLRGPQDVDPADPTEEPTDGDDPADPTEEPANDDDPADPTEEPVDDDDSSADAELPGLIAEGEYESPLYGVTILWEPTWDLGTQVDAPVISDPANGIDTVLLADVPDGTSVLYMTVEAATFATPDEYLDVFQTTSYIEDVLGLDPDSEVVIAEVSGDTAAVMIVDATQSDPQISILEVTLVDEETVVFVELRAFASNLDEDLLTAAIDDVTINGEPGFVVIDPDAALDLVP